MFKRVMMIGLMSICAVATLETEAKAYSFQGGSLCLSPQVCPPSTYQLQWLLTGGQQPGDTSIITGQVLVTNGFLICGNPGTNTKDVRKGVGGTTPVLSATDDQGAFDKRGRLILTLLFGNRVEEFVSQEAFESFWGVSNEDCKSSNWTPLEYRIQSCLINGDVFRDCTDPDDTATCAKHDDNITISCTTNNPLGDSVFKCTEVQ